MTHDIIVGFVLVSIFLGLYFKVLGIVTYDHKGKKDGQR